MKQPFFSVVIPTYNRPTDLRHALLSVLWQTCDSYEIIVSDNSQNSASRNICLKLKNNKIHYFQNQSNIGFTRNLYETFNKARGKYIFILGDDDLIGSRNLLENVQKNIEQKDYGYVRVSFFYYNIHHQLFSLFLKKHVSYKIGVNAKSLEILDFLDRSIYNLISGLVFRRPDKLYIKEISESDDKKLDLSDFWVVYLFDAIKKSGGWIDYYDKVLVRWSEYRSPTFYNLVGGRLQRELVWDLLASKLTKDEIKILVKRDTFAFAQMLISIVYYSSRTNLIAFVQRLFVLNPDLKRKPILYIRLLAALAMPHWLWQSLRRVYFSTHKIGGHLK